MSERRPGPVTRPSVVVGALLAVLAMAPTPGDIGGCGQPAEDLDQNLFYATLRSYDCAACKRCSLDTLTCQDACGTTAPLFAPTFPVDCAPLAHDGEVCLRRIQVESCDDVKTSMADDDSGKVVPIEQRPRPSECQFCPPRGSP